MEKIRMLSLRLLLTAAVVIGGLLCHGQVFAAEPPSLTREILNLYPAQVYRLTLTDTTRSARFTVQDPAVARVDEKGVVTALSVGNTEIHCVLGTGETLTCLVNVREGSAPESVALSENSLTLYPKEQHTLRGLPLPEGGVDAFLWWYSSDDSVATVDQNGIVCALRPGVAVITAESVSSAVSGACLVRVVSEGEESVFGCTLQGLLLSASGETLPNTPLEWQGALSGMKTTTDTNGRFSFQNVLMGSGLLSVYAEGREEEPVSANVTVSHSDEKLTCIVSPGGLVVLSGSSQSQSTSPREILLGREVEKMEVGEQIALNFTLLPASAGSSGVLFSSSDEKVLQVSEDGVLTAVGPGSAQAILSSQDGRVTRRCTVIVQDTGPQLAQWLQLYLELLILLLLVLLICLLVREPVLREWSALRHRRQPPESKE